jgi:hypothetical protein
VGAETSYKGVHKRSPFQAHRKSGAHFTHSSLLEAAAVAAAAAPSPRTSLRD